MSRLETEIGSSTIFNGTYVRVEIPVNMFTIVYQYILPYLSQMWLTYYHAGGSLTDVNLKHNGHSKGRLFAPSSGSGGGRSRKPSVFDDANDV